MIRIKSPGRICLFGEHQDYLNYPVIAMAISKYIYLEAERIPEKKFKISLPDINEHMEIQLKGGEIEYLSKRDYLRSGYNQFIRKNLKFKNGYSIKITGEIPINAGAASSSALVMAWLYFLNFILGCPFTKNELANMGYLTEVAEFGEAGGKMDFFTSIHGNVIYLEPKKQNDYVLEFPLKLEGFVLGDSLEKKQTVDDLRRVKTLSLKSFEILQSIMPEFNEFKTSLKEIDTFLPNLEMKYQKKIIGNIINRDLTKQALELINNFTSLKVRTSNDSINFHRKLGHLLNLHEKQLKEKIEIITPKIDLLIRKCLEGGALGAKINGSGFGGTMFALSPGNELLLKEIIEKNGGNAYSIKTSDGVENY
ncbi:MAG: GHMP kinase [Promethearchaeota archaeon]|nr:MAG: GHMP kinase [Candidatus Lokiarchaeota archaeon]